MNNFYVYRHVRLDKNIPFYIGIGHTPYYTRANSKKGRNQHWKNITSCCEYEVEILIENLTKEQAKEKEKEFIKLYGRADLNKGTLCNYTDGGDGLQNPSERTREMIRNLHRGNTYFKGKKLTKEHRESISKARKGKKLSEETKLKLRNANLGKRNQNGADKRIYRPLTDEEKLNLTNKLKGRSKSEETKKKMSLSRKGWVPSEEVKNKIKNTLIEWNKLNAHNKPKPKPKSEETRRKISEAKKGKKLTEEHRKKISQSLYETFRKKIK